MDRFKITDTRGHPSETEQAAVDMTGSLSGSEQPAQLFFQLTRRLMTRFEISKGVLLLKANANGPLAAISTWNNGQTRDGLAIKLPSESSLFERVAECGQVYTENFCGSFSGNFLEGKLLISEDSGYFVLHPLKHQGEVIGMIGFSSDKPTAFSLFEEGAVDEILSEFTDVIRQRLWSN